MKISNQTTWAIAKSKIAVLVNGVVIPFEQVPESFQRFVRAAIFTTNDPSFELRASGSSTMVMYGGRKFALSTKHQTSLSEGCNEQANQPPPPDSFVIIEKYYDSTISIPPSSYNKVNFEDETTNSDLLIFEFLEDHIGIQYLNLNSVFWSDHKTTKPDLSFLLGFPTSSRVIELAEDGMSYKHFKSRWIWLELEETEHVGWDMEERLMFKKHSLSNKELKDLDGLSGCPVFSVIPDKNNDRQLRFDGIVTHAANDRFAVYQSSVIRRVLNEIDKKTVE